MTTFGLHKLGELVVQTGPLSLAKWASLVGLNTPFTPIKRPFYSVQTPRGDLDVFLCTFRKKCQHLPSIAGNPDVQSPLKK